MTSNPSRIIDIALMSRVDIPQVTYAGNPSLSGVFSRGDAAPRGPTHQVQSTGAGPMTVSMTLSGEAVSHYTETAWIDDDARCRSATRRARAGISSSRSSPA